MIAAVVPTLGDGPLLRESLHALRRERVGQSIWYLRRAVKLKPKKARYRYNLALSLSRTKESADAMKEVDAALALDPDAELRAKLEDKLDKGLVKEANAALNE